MDGTEKKKIMEGLCFNPPVSVGKGTSDELNSSGGEVSSTNIDILQSRQEREISLLVSTSEGKGGRK
jgi:hypothetical protein